MGGSGEELVAGADRRLGLMVEAGIVERERGPVTQLLEERDIVRRVRLARGQTQQGHRPGDPAVGAEGQNHQAVDGNCWPGITGA